MNSLEVALHQIQTVRRYSASLIESIDHADWYRMTDEGVSHIAWQVGHIAMAQYRLVLVRLRGPEEEDEKLISSDFIRIFGKGSTPVPQPEVYPCPDDILSVYHHVHRRVMEELPRFPLSRLSEPPEEPHPLFNTKLDSLLWSAQHEMLHAGQIGLLRRLLGAEPRW
ncbi:DinB family protein [Blastopirellula sp. JC732]|uniref:DinB family protein n=1 Tax=Blastopirellula sediminis TaxID=2894196 RepID=A0A9X1MJ78_9BACT|nr:DinB family protein [Blastopirellula sediminis]MCC9609482.1 DinB family protein [Blastopirellula sediminis]MCC9627741.1 DinB family protein [Blastopirellula sediminis]